MTLNNSFKDPDQLWEEHEEQERLAREFGSEKYRMETELYEDNLFMMEPGKRSKKQFIEGHNGKTLRRKDSRRRGRKPSPASEMNSIGGLIYMGDFDPKNISPDLTKTFSMEKKGKYWFFVTRDCNAYAIGPDGLAYMADHNGNRVQPYDARTQGIVEKLATSNPASGKYTKKAITEGTLIDMQKALSGVTGPAQQVIDTKSNGYKANGDGIGYCNRASLPTNVIPFNKPTNQQSNGHQKPLERVVGYVPQIMPTQSPMNVVQGR